ncbi:MAG: response regulator transcription factor [Gammaproteobacteria bacterium]|nr:response regulator transcription factor [Gammaproteobacteria bacterium]MBL6998982.1 response regulator transcription factor [Gammaproteobacteria bacterium]
MSLIAFTTSASFKKHLSAVLADDIEFKSVLTRLETGTDRVYFLHVSTLGSDCFEWLKQLARNSRVRVVMCSDQPNISEMLEAVRAGANAYCHSYMQQPHYQQLQRLVSNGQSWFPVKLLELSFELAYKALNGVDVEVLLEALTRREKDIAVAVSKGLSNKKIAARFSITESTVKRHLSNIFKKLQLPDRVALVLHLKNS